MIQYYCRIFLQFQSNPIVNNIEFGDIKSWLQILAIAMLALVIAGCAPARTSVVETPAECLTPDNITRVQGGDECLVIHTFNARPGNQTLFVFIHGDIWSDTPADGFDADAKRIAREDVTAVVLVRPGYLDAAGSRSSGNGYIGIGDAYRGPVVSAIASAIGKLKEHHQSKRVVLIGQSGGAAISGVILGQYPGLANAAVLTACPCNIRRWTSMNQWRSRPHSLSPHNYVNSVPVDTEVVAITGSQDDNTHPVIAKLYIEKLQKKGVSAKFIKLDHADHSEVKDSVTFRAAVQNCVTDCVENMEARPEIFTAIAYGSNAVGKYAWAFGNGDSPKGARADALSNCKTSRRHKSIACKVLQAGILECVAIAVSSANRGNYGYSYGYGTELRAEERAIKECQKRGGKCEIALNSEDERASQCF